MPEFFNVLPPAQALDLLLERLEPCPGTEDVPTRLALGRVTACEVRAPEELPTYPRATMDGYSVRAQDTFGATEGLPAYLEVVGEVPMGRPPEVTLGPGQAARAYTGGLLAHGADAVVMVEHTQAVGDDTIEVLRPVAPGENVVQPGEDVGRDDVVLPAGHLVRPQDIGALMALGITRVSVARRPRVAVISTGDELVPPEERPGPGRIRDINTYTVSALVEEAGAQVVATYLLPDDYEAQRSAAAEALGRADVLVFSAGSSVSARDMTAQVIDSLGEPGVLVHGISIKPGKPTIVALLDGKPAFGLPGNPVSAVVVFQLLVAPTLYRLAGCPRPPEPPRVTARLTRDVPSTTGREDYVPVRLVAEDGGLGAEPIFGKSNLIFTLVKADGLLRVPLDRGGLYQGEAVQVRLFR